MKKHIFATGLAALLTFSCTHSLDNKAGTTTAATDRTPQSTGQQDDNWYSRFGACLVSPDNHDYENEWNTYHQLIQKKVKINIEHYAEMPVSKEIREFISNLALITPILEAWDAIKQSAWSKHMFADKNFVELTSSAAFVYAMRDENFVSQNKDPIFVSEYNDPNDDTFRKNFDIILSTMRDPDAQPALTYFHRANLVFVDLAGLASALKLAHFFKFAKPDGEFDYNKIKGAIGNAANDLNYVPFMNDIPVPEKATGSADNFGTAYWTQLQASIAQFLETFPTSNPQLDSLVSPDDTIPYDDYVVKSHANDEQTQFQKTIFNKQYNIGVHEIIAIDGVARTLWGEAASCDVGKSVHGFSAVGLVMANRAIAVQNSLNEKVSVKQANKSIEQQDVNLFMNSDAKSSLKGFIPEKSLGQADFGRKGSLELAASQVVSRPAQFSCWNGYTTHLEKLSTIAGTTHLPKGLPDFDYAFKVPERPNDEHDLINVLCPTISANVHKNDGLMGWDMNFPSSYDVSWRSAVDTATLIVLDPELYKKLYNFTPAPESAPLFYTNGGIILPGLPRLQVDGMVYHDPETRETESFSGGTSCNVLKVFSARSRTVYGVSP